MIHIVTGRIDSGKTTRMLTLHEQLGGDGFVSIKHMGADGPLRYECQRLSSGERFTLAVRTASNEPSPAASTLGPYRFFLEATKRVENVMSALVERRIEPLFLDEVGPLELRGDGFDAVVSLLVDSCLDVYLSVRQSALEQVIEQYGITNYRIVPQEA